MGCVIYSGEGYTTIFWTPTKMSRSRSTRMGLAGGLMGAYMTSKSEPFWTVSGGLAGVIAVAAGIDLYQPALAFVIAVIGGAIIPYSGRLVEKFGIDAVAWVLQATGLLRSPPEVELLGLDLSELPAAPYPEGIPPTAVSPRFVPVNGSAAAAPAGSYSKPEA